VSTEKVESRRRPSSYVEFRNSFQQLFAKREKRPDSRASALTRQRAPPLPVLASAAPSFDPFRSCISRGERKAP